MSIPTIILITLCVAVIMLIVMAHQAHMRNKSTGGYFFGLLAAGYLIFMISMMVLSGKG